MDRTQARKGREVTFKGNLREIKNAYVRLRGVIARDPYEWEDTAQVTVAFVFETDERKELEGKTLSVHIEDLTPT